MARNTDEHAVIDVQGYFYPSPKLNRLVAVDANGSDIAFASMPDTDSAVNLLTATGFFSSMYPGHGRLATFENVFFTDSTCGTNGGTSWTRYDNTQAYIPGTIVDTNYYEGVPPSQWPTANIWYLPNSPVFATNVVSQSRLRDGSCTLTNGAVLPEAVQMLPNNPSITGIANSPYPAPLSLEYR